MITLWKNASKHKRSWLVVLAVVLALLLGFLAKVTIELIAYRAVNITGNSTTSSKTLPSKVWIEQGAYLAILGNCAACHTDRGGAAFAGGKAIQTPFGAVFASNITPDLQHGIGLWSADAFYRAMHHGVNAQGKLLTPAFPYPNTTHISRADSDTLYAYFMHGVQPVATPSKAHELSFPFNTQLALAVWRVLFFERGSENTINSIAVYADFIRATDQKSFKNEVERGRYIVQGLAHCSACHAERNALGASRSDGLLSGALMPMHDGYAPSLHAKEEAGVQHWPREQIVALLKNGITHDASLSASVLGPMAEVVAKSTQYWRDEDLSATAAYLQSLPLKEIAQTSASSAVRPAFQSAPRQRQHGANVYAQHCATCHGDNGQGLQETDALAPQGLLRIPALAGNRAVSLPSSANLVRIILAGGYAPSTAGNPRPYGMPPFVHVLSDEDIAAVVTHIRTSWGNTADAVSGVEVVAQRRGVLR